MDREKTYYEIRDELIADMEMRVEQSKNEFYDVVNILRNVVLENLGLEEIDGKLKFKEEG